MQMGQLIGFGSQNGHSKWIVGRLAELWVDPYFFHMQK